MASTELIHDCYGINKKGHFTLSGVDTVDLAKEYGTPLYVLSEEKVREMCRIYNSALSKYFTKAKVSYASKALSFVGIYEIIKTENMYVDAVSQGEIFASRVAGFPSENVYFHGNNKTDEDIKYAFACKVGHIVVDSFDELHTVEALAARHKVHPNVILRITPGIDPHTNVKILTGSVDSKFGVPIETGQAIEFVKDALNQKHLTLEGVHCHVGSQLFDTEPFYDSVNIMLDFIAEVKSKTGYTLKVLDIGGGIGVRYIPSQPHPDIDLIMKNTSVHFKNKCKELGIEEPEFIIEPGRSIVAAAGVTLYRVGTVKEIPEYKNYISVDGGMADNPRYALYEAPYYSLIANKADKDMNYNASIVGRCCESGDVIQENVMIQKPVRGDVLAVTVTGAYNYSMSSNYNKLPKPALVIVGEDKTCRIGIKRETLADLIRTEI